MIEMQYLYRALEKRAVLPSLETQLKDKTVKPAVLLSIIAPDLPLLRYNSLQSISNALELVEWMSMHSVICPSLKLRN